ncbi:LuxR C-terminal-related transcriptional regulator [Anaerocolumna sp. AGMB13025]|uniref:LuxR C-terminal-related transcriptional regulator n=1 Tax=Anaerocolumna sp. AGMB13025 TaxID=3039116 RepID=UPI00242042B4|nr:LuxR C-terminal-related transcriptional regulator [Anaerocolumna sp. AGMB13025]WFR57578.1 LuxR C-terminal-related transcriptional regulator [Anaerocolumna sp. AGMB13025]
MAVINCINDKFIPAPLPGICAPRQELLNLYNEASANRLAVVCAPAGYGKTISTLLWVKASGRKSVWIGLDEYDNAQFVFYKLFCTGILSAQPDNTKMQEILSSKAFNSAPIEYTINLLSEFVQDEQTYVLILDDLHTITNKEILKSLPFILKRLPHSFHVLLLSRVNLSEEFNELTDVRKVIPITALELSFSAVEIQQYYSALGRAITRNQAQTVLDITGGWAMGIGVLSKSEQIEPVQGDDRILANYINKNIWEKWDKELREFMLLTSAADELDAPLCSILTNRQNTEAVLHELIVQNAFVIKTSANTYRYHHLFLDFLRGKLMECTDIQISALNLKLASLYFDRKEYFTALDYYVRARNHDGIDMSLYELNVIYMDFSVEEWLNTFSVLVHDKLSDEFIKEDIPLLIEFAWTNFLNGNAEATLHYIDMIYDYLESEEKVKVIMEKDMIGYVSVIRFADFRQSLYEYSEEFSNWINTLPEKNLYRINMYTPSMTQNFPIMHRSIFDCLDIVLDMDNRLQAIKEAFGIFYANETDLFCYCVRSGLYYELNELEKANKVILLAQSKLKKDTRLEIRFCVFMILSLILNAMEKNKESETARMTISEYIKKENALYLLPNMSAIDVKQRLWDADKEAAKLWLEKFFVTNDEQLYFYKLYQYFTTVRAYIVLSKREEALVIIQKLKKIGTEYHRPLDIAEAAVLQAVLEWATGFKKEAVKTLETVLVAMQPYWVMRIIADEGGSVLPILKKIIAKTDRADYQGQIDRHYLEQVYICAYKVSKKHKGITAYLNEKPVKLSKQQTYILKLLAQGYKNAEIVKMTGLTINTIKAHTKLVYLKLGVNCAVDAILKAKSLGIIDS